MMFALSPSSLRILYCAAASAQRRGLAQHYCCILPDAPDFSLVVEIGAPSGGNHPKYLWCGSVGILVTQGRAPNGIWQSLVALDTPAPLATDTIRHRNSQAA